MAERLPNFLSGAIYRSKSERAGPIINTPRHGERL
jgi:hypothetical protein